MLSFVAALVGTTLATSGAGDAQVANLPAIFEATCLDGQARLSAGDVTATTFDQLPEQLKESLGHPASGNVWRLNTAGNSYLYVLNYPDSAGVSPKVCGLASDAMDMKTARDALGARVAGGTERGNGEQSAQWLNAQDGYIATATSAKTFKVLQISWMSDAAKAQAMQQIAQLPH